MGYQVDEIDKKVIYYLSKNARKTSSTNIAEKAEVSPATVRNRIYNLENQGIIEGYHAQINYEKVDGKLTNLFLGTCSIPERQEIVEKALQIPGIIQLTELMTGKKNLLITAIGNDTNDITRIARELSIIGVNIENEALIQRQQFHPYHEFGPREVKETPKTSVRRLAGEKEIADLEVQENSPISGKNIKEASKKSMINKDILIISINRDGEVITPKGQTELKTGDKATLFSKKEIPEETIKAFTQPKDKNKG